MLKYPSILLIAFYVAGMAGCTSPFDADRTQTDSPQTWTEKSEIGPYVGGIASIAFSPDGKHVATTHTSIHPYEVRASPLLVLGELKIWDIDTGVNQSSITIKKLTLHPVSWSEDSSHAILLVDEQLLAWNVDESRLEKQHVADANIVSPAGGLVAGEDSNSNVTVFDVSRRHDSQLLIKDLPHRAVQFSNDGALLATLVGDWGEQREVAIWKWTDEELLCRVPCKAYSRSFFEFSPDNTVIATTSIDEEFLHVFSTADGTRRAWLPIGTSHIWGIAFSPDSKLIAVCTEGTEEKREATVKVWSIESGKLLTEINDKDHWGFTAVAFSPDGQSLAVGTPAGELKFFGVASE